MNEDLQAALNWVESGPTVVGAEHINELAKAARLVANPNYRAHVQHNVALYVSDADAKLIVDLALTPQEATDE